MKKSLVYLLSILSTTIGTGQGINGVYSAKIDKSEVVLYLYEDNLNLFGVYQYFKKEGKKKPTEQVVMMGYVGTKADLFVLKACSGKLEHLNIDFYWTDTFKGSLAGFPNHITPTSCSHCGDKKLTKKTEPSSDWLKFKAEIEKYKIETLYEKNRQVRNSNNGFGYYLLDGKEWISFTEANKAKFYIHSSNQGPNNTLKVLISTNLPNTNDVLNYVIRWLKYSKRLWIYSYPTVRKIEFYRYLGNANYSFNPDKHILTANKSIGGPDFVVSLTEGAKNEIGQNELSLQAKFQKIKELTISSQSLKELRDFKWLVTKSRKETNFYNNLLWQIDQLEKDMIDKLINQAYLDLEKIEYSDIVALKKWHTDYENNFFPFGKHYPQRPQNKFSERDIEVLFWSKSEKYWTDNFSQIEDQIVNSDREQLDKLADQHDFLEQISAINNHQGFYPKYKQKRDAQYLIIKEKEEQLILEKRKQLEEERKRKIASGELCECCNNKPVNCYRCDGKGFLKNYSAVLQDHVVVDCSALCDRWIERCSCCKMIYKR